MQGALLSLVLSELGRDALKVVAGLFMAVVIALAFAIASLAALFGAAAPGHEIASARPDEIPPDQLAVMRRTTGGPPSQVIDLARAQIGRPYVWGGASPQTSFDCSGLVQWVYRQVGVGLPRTAQQQFDATVRISPAELRPGDLIFFQICCQPPDTVTHVGIYIGSGQMIHAPAPGEAVRVESINTPYWRSHLAGAGRPAHGPAGAVQ